MTDDIGAVAGYLLAFLICAWAVWFLAAQLLSNVKKGTAVDQTLSALDKSVAPGMFSLQILGFVLLIGASAMIGIGAMVVLVQRLLALREN